jgi:hypothetical protein
MNNYHLKILLFVSVLFISLCEFVRLELTIACAMSLLITYLSFVHGPLHYW